MKQKLKIFAPMQRAWEKTSDFCFNPFSFTKWFVLGFVTWIISFGEGSCFLSLISNAISFKSFGQDLLFKQSKLFIGGKNPLFEIFNKIDNYRQNELNMEVLHSTLKWVYLALFAGFVIWLIISWIKSRVEFILLDNIVNDKYEIFKPWSKYSPEGNSLFKWRITFKIITSCVIMVYLLCAIGIPIVMSWMSLQQQEWMPDAEKGVQLGIRLLIITLILALLFEIINFIVNNCLVPIMYIEKIGITESWRRFRPLLKTNFFSLFIFLLTFVILKFVLNLVTSIAIGIIFLLTCCFFIVGALPFINGYIVCILILPVSLFFRYFCYEYITQIQLSKLQNCPQNEFDKAFDSEINTRI